MSALSEFEESEAGTSLATLFKRYRGAIYAYFLRRIRHTADAEDLTHDVFVRLGRLPPDLVKPAIAGSELLKKLAPMLLLSEGAIGLRLRIASWTSRS